MSALQQLTASGWVLLAITMAAVLTFATRFIFDVLHALTGRIVKVHDVKVHDDICAVVAILVTWFAWLVTP